MRTIILLTVSNVFMTFAWYGHLKYKTSPLWIAIAASWGIAFVEYCFQVPANRIGSYQYSTAQLKTIQEVITLIPGTHYLIPNGIDSCAGCVSRSNSPRPEFTLERSSSGLRNSLGDTARTGVVPD